MTHFEKITILKGVFPFPFEAMEPFHVAFVDFSHENNSFGSKPYFRFLTGQEKTFTISADWPISSIMREVLEKTFEAGKAIGMEKTANDIKAILQIKNPES